MTYTTPSKPLDPALIVAAKLQLLQVLHQAESSLIIDAIAELKTQLPETLDVTLCLTWATAMEQLAFELPLTLTTWKQALLYQANNLRLQARAPFPA